MGKHSSKKTFEVDIPRYSKNSDIPNYAKKIRVVVDQETGNVSVEGANCIRMKLPLHIQTSPYQEPDGALFVQAGLNEMANIEVGFALDENGLNAGPVMSTRIVTVWGKDFKPGISFLVKPHPSAASPTEQEVRLISPIPIVPVAPEQNGVQAKM